MDFFNKVVQPTLWFIVKQIWQISVAKSLLLHAMVFAHVGRANSFCNALVWQKIAHLVQEARHVYIIFVVHLESF